MVLFICIITPVRRIFIYLLKSFVPVLRVFFLIFITLTLFSWFAILLFFHTKEENLYFSNPFQTILNLVVNQFFHSHSSILILPLSFFHSHSSTLILPFSFFHSYSSILILPFLFFHSLPFLFFNSSILILFHSRSPFQLKRCL